MLGNNQRSSDSRIVLALSLLRAADKQNTKQMLRQPNQTKMENQVRFYKIENTESGRLCGKKLNYSTAQTVDAKEKGVDIQDNINLPSSNHQPKEPINRWGSKKPPLMYAQLIAVVLEDLPEGRGTLQAGVWLILQQFFIPS